MSRGVFTGEDRRRVTDLVLEFARADPRIVAGALVGSLARGDADRWSDVDLTFSITGGADPIAVLDDLTARLAGAESGVHLVDITSGSTIYRVLLFPGALQVDISVTPEHEFVQRGPGFDLRFGKAAPAPPLPPADPRPIFGLAVLFAFHARTCIERGLPWQAEYGIGVVREKALALDCLRRGLRGSYGRDRDRLPAELLKAYEATLVTGAHAGELRRALSQAVARLLGATDDMEITAWLRSELLGLTAPTS